MSAHPSSSTPRRAPSSSLPLTSEKAIHRLIDATPLHRREKALLHQLARSANATLSCIRSQTTLARAIGCSVDTIARAQPALEKQGKLAVVRRHSKGGHQTSSEYRLQVSFIQQGDGRLPIAFWSAENVVPLPLAEPNTDPQIADRPIRNLRDDRGSSSFEEELTETSPPALDLSRSETAEGGEALGHEGISGTLEDLDEVLARAGDFVAPAPRDELEQLLEQACEVIETTDANPPQQRKFACRELRRLVDAGVHPTKLPEFAEDFAKKNGPFFGLRLLRPAVDKTIAGLTDPISSNSGFVERYRRRALCASERAKWDEEQAYIRERVAKADADEVLGGNTGDELEAPVPKKKAPRSKPELSGPCRPPPPELLDQLMAMVGRGRAPQGGGTR